MEFIVQPVELPVIRDIICKGSLECGRLICLGSLTCGSITCADRFMCVSVTW